MKKIMKPFLILFLLSPLSALADGEGVYRGLSNFTKVLDLIERNYVEEVDPEELTSSAIDGMIKTLDPYSAYMSPERYKELEIGTSGEFGGVGMEVAVENGIISVITPIEGSPAANAGIKPGDQILAIDGQSTKGMALYDAVKMLRGPKGSKVKITLRREGEDSLREIQLTRDIVHIESVKFKLLDDGIGYIKVSQFQENVSKDLKESLSQLETNKGVKLKGLILDLRNNPGGLLDEAIEITDEFIDEGLIVSVKGRFPSETKEYYATKGAIRDYPLVVIVNKGSASASEVVAEALQDSKRAKILGTKTFGKGSVQTIIRLDDGSGLKLTTAKFYAPSGRSISEIGVIPDIIVEEDGILDNQLERAIEFLKFSNLNNSVPKGLETPLL